MVEISFLWALLFMIESGAQASILKVKPLLQIERSQLNWFRHLIRMPSSGLLLEVYDTSNWEEVLRSVQDSLKRSLASWEWLGFLLEEVEEVARDRDAWDTLLSIMPLQS